MSNIKSLEVKDAVETSISENDNCTERMSWDPSWQLVGLTGLPVDSTYQRLSLRRQGSKRWGIVSGCALSDLRVFRACSLLVLHSVSTDIGTASGA
jgi:hypothetical protein